MAGLIAALFGGKSAPAPLDPLPGQGGYAMPPGPSGQDGFPGSTSQTRTFRGTNPRAFKVRADTNYGITPVTQARAEMQDVPGEFYGGPMLHTQPGLNDTAGANPLEQAQAAGGHSGMDTETPETRRRFQISRNVPGAQNVRNTYAEDYKARPGMLRAYRPAFRGDDPSASRGEVLAESRFVFAGGGVETYAMERQMPYGGRGDGARGADLNGSRYYATWTGADEFVSAAAGEYGISRLRGPNHRPVMFAEPAPWSANYYDTTASVGTPSDPGSGGQAPDMVYVSPPAGRARNGIGRG